MQKKYNTVIIEDDIKSLKLLSHFIGEYCANLQIIDTANSIEKGISLLKKEKPDIVFLDIMLNENLVFDLLDVINHSSFQIIFVSSVQKHTIKAFKYSPVDYLLKPFKITELINSVDRAIEKIEINNSNKKETKDYIAVSSGKEIVILKIPDILFCESGGNYTIFHTKESKKIMALNNIGTFEERLPKSSFFRIHKKYIVNLNHIKSIYKADGGYCQMSNDEILSISRRQHAELQKILLLK